MENNLENKGKFFAQYWCQNVARYDSGILDKVSHPIGMIEYLLLTPLSQITDEDAIEVAKLVGSNYGLDKVVISQHEDRGRRWTRISKEYIDYEGKISYSILFNTANDGIISHCANMRHENFIEVTDYLRSRGYALPYNGLSVQQQIEYGWVKLRE